MNHFQREFPKIVDYLRKQQAVKTRTSNPAISRLHWLLLGIFGLLTIASFSQQVLLLFLLIGGAALIKGPVMLLYGAVYSFLISLFPPLGIFLSLLFFLLSLRQIARNWRFGVTASFFYLYPLALTAAKAWAGLTSFWLIALLMGLGFFIVHFLLQHLYRHYGTSQSVAWSLLAVPYDCLLFFIPSKSKKAVSARSSVKKSLFR